MDKKQVREWQFVNDNGEVVNGEVEIDDETFEMFQSGMSERERQRLIDHYDRLAKWRFYHPLNKSKLI